jgi:hypothetical protein
MPNSENELPLPVGGTWPYDFHERVDSYQAAHGISRADVFRRISAITGNSPNGLALRYGRPAYDESRRRVAETMEPSDDASVLPLPDSHGVWPVDFPQRVDAYKGAHGLSRAEVFRRISAQTGNAVNGLSLRYYKGK